MISKSTSSFCVLLPTSLLADAPNLRQKTLKASLVGRALAIFQVNNVCVYNDDDLHVRNQVAEAELISTLLRYMETPQYLRKLLFTRRKELRYAGLLPPLRTPHHPLEDEKNKPGDCREAVVLEVVGRGSLLEIGLRERGLTKERLKAKERLTVKLGEHLDRDTIAAVRAARAEVGEYWGYDVSRTKSLAEGLNRLKANYVIGTSRRGQNLHEAVRAMRSSNPGSMTVAFGGPYAGLLEICDRQGVDAGELFDVLVNTIPEQGTVTVRTEEALIATLALLNVLVRE